MPPRVDESCLLCGVSWTFIVELARGGSGRRIGLSLDAEDAYGLEQLGRSPWRPSWRIVWFAREGAGRAPDRQSFRAGSGSSGLSVRRLAPDRTRRSKLAQRPYDPSRGVTMDFTEVRSVEKLRVGSTLRSRITSSVKVALYKRTQTQDGTLADPGSTLELVVAITYLGKWRPPCRCSMTSRVWLRCAGSVDSLEISFKLIRVSDAESIDYGFTARENQAIVHAIEVRGHGPCRNPCSFKRLRW